jgi:hypothetical protein
MKQLGISLIGEEHMPFEDLHLNQQNIAITQQCGFERDRRDAMAVILARTQLQSPQSLVAHLCSRRPADTISLPSNHSRKRTKPTICFCSGGPAAV